jgi:hypothetical protein
MLPAQFYSIQGNLQAFSMKDLQTFATFLIWTEQLGLSHKEITDFLHYLPLYRRLEMNHYFNPMIPPEQSKVVRQIEKDIPRELRRELRKVRLERSFSGMVGR